MVTIFATSGACFFVVDPDLKSHTDGPNCWNGALFAVGIVKSLRFTHPDEFLYLLDRYCVETQTPKSGDLGRMYDDKEVHAFIWLNESEVYAKHSNSSDETYKTMSVEKMLSSYNMKRECALDKVKDKSCFRKTAYYDCHPKMDKTQIEMLILEPIESLIHELVFSVNTKFKYKELCTSDSFIQRNELLLQIDQQIQALKGLQHFDLVYLEKWVLSIKGQIYDSEVSAGYYRCKGMSHNEKYISYKKVKDNLNKLLLELQK